MDRKKYKFKLYHFLKMNKMPLGPVKDVFFTNFTTEKNGVMKKNTNSVD